MSLKKKDKSFFLILRDQFKSGAFDDFFKAPKRSLGRTFVNKSVHLGCANFCWNDLAMAYENLQLGSQRPMYYLANYLHCDVIQAIS